MALAAASRFGGLLVLVLVMAQMTTLAHCLEIRLGAIFWRVIEVRDRKDNEAPRPLGPDALAFLAASWAWMRPVQSTFPLTFTLAPAARLNQRANGLPVSGITCSFSRANRHVCGSWRQRPSASLEVRTARNSAAHSSQTTAIARI